jgi:hypothetical protein
MIAIESWSGFRPFAMLYATSAELAESSGLEFRSSFDDLDEVRESAFSGKSGTVYGVIEHVHSPIPGVEILAHESHLANGALFPTLDALSGLGLGNDKVRWSLAPQRTAGAHPQRRIYIGGHDLHLFHSDFLEAIRNTIRASGFHAVGLWEDLTLEGRLKEHTLLLEQSAMLLYLTTRLDSWSYYELGLARALRKPVWALVLEGSKRDPGVAPRFDREVRVDVANLGSVSQTLRAAFEEFSRGSSE